MQWMGWTVVLWTMKAKLDMSNTFCPLHPLKLFINGEKGHSTIPFQWNIKDALLGSYRSQGHFLAPDATLTNSRYCMPLVMALLEYLSVG